MTQVLARIYYFNAPYIIHRLMVSIHVLSKFSDKDTVFILIFFFENDNVNCKSMLLRDKLKGIKVFFYEILLIFLTLAKMEELFKACLNFLQIKTSLKPLLTHNK